jgi:hypothetical protein
MAPATVVGEMGCGPRGSCEGIAGLFLWLGVVNGADSRRESVWVRRERRYGDERINRGFALVLFATALFVRLLLSRFASHAFPLR